MKMNSVNVASNPRFRWLVWLAPMFFLVKGLLWLAAPLAMVFYNW